MNIFKTQRIHKKRRKFLEIQKLLREIHKILGNLEKFSKIKKNYRKLKYIHLLANTNCIRFSTNKYQIFVIKITDMCMCV